MQYKNWVHVWVDYNRCTAHSRTRRGCKNCQGGSRNWLEILTVGDSGDSDLCQMEWPEGGPGKN
jgi:hypothetical protein